MKKRLKSLEAKVAKDGMVITEEQLVALENARQDKEAHGQIETEHPGYLGARDTFYAGTLKDVLDASTSRHSLTSTHAW